MIDMSPGMAATRLGMQIENAKTIVARALDQVRGEREPPWPQNGRRLYMYLANNARAATFYMSPLLTVDNLNAADVLAEAYRMADINRIGRGVVADRSIRLDTVGNPREEISHIAIKRQFANNFDDLDYFDRRDTLRFILSLAILTNGYVRL